jgi:hypothetical protein
LFIQQLLSWAAVFPITFIAARYDRSRSVTITVGRPYRFMARFRNLSAALPSRRFTKVAAVTNGSENPWINSSVKGDFCFREGKTAPAASVPASGGLTPEIVFWQSIANSDDPTMFEAHAAHGNWGQHKVSAGLTEMPSPYPFL